MGRFESECRDGAGGRLFGRKSADGDEASRGVLVLVNAMMTQQAISRGLHGAPWALGHLPAAADCRFPAVTAACGCHCTWYLTLNLGGKGTKVHVCEGLDKICL